MRSMLAVAVVALGLVSLPAAQAAAAKKSSAQWCADHGYTKGIYIKRASVRDPLCMTRRGELLEFAANDVTGCGPLSKGGKGHLVLPGGTSTVSCSSAKTFKSKKSIVGIYVAK